MNWFTKWLMKENDVEKPSEPVVEDVKVPLISEPVLSLIESLKNREWFFSSQEGNGLGFYYYNVTKLGCNLKFTILKQTNLWDGDGDFLSCRNSWMTQDESELIAKIAFEIMEAEWKEWHIVENWKEREKFMILVKEPH